MFTEFRGKSTYQAEFDIHFPTLTMRETLQFASKARKSPNDWVNFPAAVERESRTLGLTNALDVKMGNALVPGVSGGERKRTSIAVHWTITLAVHRLLLILLGNSRRRQCLSVLG